MKAEMTAAGQIVLMPETGIEAFALMRWTEQAVVDQPDIPRKEQFYYRGSSIAVDLSRFPEAMRTVFDSTKMEAEWCAASTGGWPASRDR